MTALESCDTEYIYEPLSGYRQQIFQHIDHYIPADVKHLLDLGCGAVGFYWALAYLNRVKSMTFADQHAGSLSVLSERIDQLSPETIEAEFSDTIAFLQQENTIPPDFMPADWLMEFHEKLAGLKQMDALDNTTSDNKGDVILAVELFDCANTDAELETMLCFCEDTLKKRGRLIGNILHYKEWTESLENLANERLLGRLNASSEQIKTAAQKVGLKIISLETKETNMPNFPTSVFFCFEK